MRVAAWAACAAAAALAAATLARAWGVADRACVRERLLAGALDAAAIEPARLADVPGEALVLAALELGKLDAAASVARAMREAGDPLGPLYEAVAAFEAGDEPGARRALRESRVPPRARGLGARLERALLTRDAGARTLLLDRSGALVASAGADGAVHPADEAVGLLPGALERLPPVQAVPAVRLAVDLELSRAALWALGDARGSIVLVETRTGGVLAAVADPLTLAAEPQAPFAQRREPASIAKLLTAAAAYRAGLDADEAIARMSCGGVERYGGQPLWCPFPSGPLGGLDHALAVSCNLAFANLGVRLGSAAMRDEYARWGFDDGTGDLGRVHTAPATPRQLADLSVGLELVDVTPLHAALLAATIANDGRSASPRLVTGPCGPLGLTPGGSGGRTRAEQSVLDPTVARRLWRAMVEVVRSGTGAGLAPPGYPVAMKTGTAAAPGQGYHVNYIGFGPLPEASLAFCVRVTHGRSSPRVTRTARDVTRRLLQALDDRRYRRPARAVPESTASGHS